MIEPVEALGRPDGPQVGSRQIGPRLFQRTMNEGMPIEAKMPMMTVTMTNSTRDMPRRRRASRRNEWTWLMDGLSLYLTLPAISNMGM